MKKKLRVFRCKRCEHLLQTTKRGTAAHISNVFENRCHARVGGYCNYEELVPKKKKKPFPFPMSLLKY